MMCLPANFGWIASILNWFFIPVAFTPFNIIFNDLDLSWWWLVILCDGALTSGIVWLLYRLDEFMEPQKTDIDTQFCNKFGFSELADEKKQLLLD
jgi:hypothetical protein